MKSLIASLTCTLVLQVTAARADEPVPTPPVPQVTAAPLPSPPQTHPAAAGRSERGLSKVEHLREAAEHLEAAGAGELAAEVREDADSLQEESVELLNQKREQVARLLGEIADLEEVTGCNQQVMIRFRVVEMDVARMKQLGFHTDFLRGDKKVDSLFPTGLNDARMTESFVDALVTQGLAKVLAEPLIVTTNGRPATMRSGGEFPIPIPAGPEETKVAFRDFGLTLEAVPVVLGGGRIRLDLAPELATRDFSNAVTVGDTVVPGLTTRRVNTQVEMRYGETATLVMGTRSEVADPSSEEKIEQTSAENGPGVNAHIVTVICVTPEPVHAIPAQPVPDPQPHPVPDPRPLPEY